LNRLAFPLFRKVALLIAFGALPATVAVGQAPPTTDAPRYRTYDELTASLGALAQTNPSLVKLVDLGKSHEGRSVWAVEVASGARADARPALLVAANFEGDQVIGSELALSLARHLLLCHGCRGQETARRTCRLHHPARQSRRRRSDVREGEVVPPDQCTEGG